MVAPDATNSALPAQLSDHQTNSTILVVDDLVENIQVLSKILQAEGYQVRKALSGASALRSAAQAAPDLVLLDIMMPNMDGYQVCQQLKAAPQLKNVPVIFISALDALEDKVMGFEIGGVDYINKPFQAAEVIARVKTHLNLYHLQRQYQIQSNLLRQNNQQLQQEIAERKRAEEKYQSIFENASEGIFQTSVEGQYLTGNPTLAKILGYDSPEDLCQSIQDIGRQIYLNPKRRLEINSYLKRYGKITDAASQVYRKDRSTIWISENTREVRDAAGNLQYYEGTIQDITARVQVEQLLHKAQRRSEQLLLNILPQSVVQRLKSQPDIIADSLESVSILFADLVDFTAFSATVESEIVVRLLNQIFSTFDMLVESYGLQKIKTIGDAYMVVGGVPTPREDHLEAIANLALDMQEAMADFKALTTTGYPIPLRIGIHSGPVIAGVIGKKALAFDVWGHAVNLASRMEETSLPGKIQVATASYEQLRDRFQFEKRGSVNLQGIGPIETYFLTGKI